MTTAAPAAPATPSPAPTAAPAAPAATTLAAPPAPIPFRQTGAVSGPEVMSVLGMTVALLAAATAAAWYARKRGWLDRWVGAAVAGAPPARRLAVTETLRLSRATTVYRLADGGREYLVVESTGSAQLLAAQPQWQPGSAP